MGKELKTAPPASGHSQEMLSTMLTFFYPIHYRVGMELESHMCQDRLTRQQAAIIWLIASECDDEGWVKRQVIERALASWFESSNSRVSQLLKQLSSSEWGLIVQIENPSSGREKLVALTDAGRDFFVSMRQAGIDYFAEYFADLSPEELQKGIQFFKMALESEELIKSGQYDPTLTSDLATK